MKKSKNDEKPKGIDKDCFDPLGSYTGRGEEPSEKPIQDADDL